MKTILTPTTKTTPTHDEVDAWPLWKCVEYLQHSWLDFDAADLESCRRAIHQDIYENTDQA